MTFSQKTFDLVSKREYNKDMTISHIGGDATMKNILEELYYGHLCPCDRRCTPDSKEQKALDRLCAAGDLLSRRLYGEELRAFLDYEDAQEIITEESSAACFSAGFQLDARFALEVSGYGKD